MSEVCICQYTHYAGECRSPTSLNCLRDVTVPTVPYDTGYIEGGRPIVALRLSEYELINLCELLYATMYEVGSPPNPLSALNTGDWTNCLAWRIRAEIDKLCPKARPNVTKEDQRAAVYSYVLNSAQKQDKTVTKPATAKKEE